MRWVWRACRHRCGCHGDWDGNLTVISPMITVMNTRGWPVNEIMYLQTCANYALVRNYAIPYSRQMYQQQNILAVFVCFSPLINLSRNFPSHVFMLASYVSSPLSIFPCIFYFILYLRAVLTKCWDIPSIKSVRSHETMMYFASDIFHSLTICEITNITAHKYIGWHGQKVAALTYSLERVRECEDIETGT